MIALKEAVLKLVKDGVVVQNKIKVSIPGKTQAEVLNALTELVNDGELSVTSSKSRGNVYGIAFRQPLPPLEEGAPAVPPTTDSFPEKEPITKKVPEPPTQEDWDELNKLANEQEVALAASVPPVVNDGDVATDDNTADKVAVDKPNDLSSIVNRDIAFVAPYPSLKGSKPNPVDPEKKVSSNKK